MKGRYGEVKTPAYFVSGWYDNLVHEGFKCFRGWRTEAGDARTRQLTRLMVGPWTHSQIGSAEPFGDIDFGSNAGRWISPVNTCAGTTSGCAGSIRESTRNRPSGSFVIRGRNAWRWENEWPLARTNYTAYYLHSGGRANSRRGDGALSLEAPRDEPADRFDYDPGDPVPTVGGQSLSPANTGPRDRRGLETREDVLVYTTEALASDVEVTGPVELTLFAASDARDTDFTATLVDVYPDGAAIHITEGIVAGPLPRILSQAESDLSGGGGGIPDRTLGNEQFVQGRPSDQAGGVEQQLPTFRPESEYGQYPGPGQMK